MVSVVLIEYCTTDEELRYTCGSCVKLKLKFWGGVALLCIKLRLPWTRTPKKTLAKTTLATRMIIVTQQKNEVVQQTPSIPSETNNIKAIPRISTIQPVVGMCARLIPAWYDLGEIWRFLGLRLVVRILRGA